jgi:predicted dehydrogenase
MLRARSLSGAPGERQMAKEVRIGLVGYRFMGRAHSNAYISAPKFFDLDCRPVMQAVCGRNEPAVREFAGRWGWKSWETSYKKLIERDDIDIIDIATPNSSHYEIAIGALRAGKAVICEKPLALDAPQAYKMAAEAKKRGLPNMVWFNYRRCPAVALARKMIDEGALGRIYHFRAVYLQDWLSDPDRAFSWRLDKNEAGSGAHGDLNAHLIDLARYLVGEFKEVAGHSHTFVTERTLPGGELEATGKVTVDDCAMFLAALDNGAVATFEATRYATGRKNYNRIEINGSKGSLVWQFERMNELEYYDATLPEESRGFRTILATDRSHPYMKGYWPPGHIIGYEHGFVNQVADMMQALARGEALKPDFEDGLRCQETLDAVMLSARERCWYPVRRKKIRILDRDFM